MSVRVSSGMTCTVTRPDGVQYPAFLQRGDGPEACMAVLYVEPADLLDLQDVQPPIEPFEQRVYVSATGAPAGAAICTLSLSDEQLAYERERAQRFLDATG